MTNRKLRRIVERFGIAGLLIGAMGVLVMAATQTRRARVISSLVLITVFVFVPALLTKTNCALIEPGQSLRSSGGARDALMLSPPVILSDGSSIAITAVTFGKVHRAGNEIGQVDQVFLSKSSEALVFWMLRKVGGSTCLHPFIDIFCRPRIKDGTGRVYELERLSPSYYNGPLPTESREIFEMTTPPTTGHPLTLEVFPEFDMDHKKPLARFSFPNTHEWRQKLVENADQYLRSAEHLNNDLAAAMLKNDRPKVWDLTNRGAHVRSNSFTNRTDFNWAACYGYMDLATEFLQRGADIDEQDSSGRSALMWAAESGNVELARFLVQHNASPKLHDMFGQTAMSLAIRNHHSEVQRLLSSQ